MCNEKQEGLAENSYLTSSDASSSSSYPVSGPEVAGSATNRDGWRLDGTDNEPSDVKTAESDIDTTGSNLRERRNAASSGIRQGQKSRTGRHGARNQHRHKHFVKWLVQTFPQLSAPNNNHHVLDVAGGKGETAGRLAFCHLQNVVMVDPRLCNLEACLEGQVIPKLPKKWQQRYQAQRRANPNFLQDVVSKRFRQIVTTFDETTLANSREMQEAISNASVLIGLHADGATEAIVDAALQFNKPFVVVPCCVFPSLFSKRTLVQPDGETIVQVRSHEQFCQYLLRKDCRFVMETLPFQGRNVAIWWDGDGGMSTTKPS